MRHLADNNNPTNGVNMTEQGLAAKMQRLEDIEAIHNLKAKYCDFCDDGYDADGIASLFVEDAVWEGEVPVRKKHEGREAIRALFSGMSNELRFAVHNVINPIIEVNGDTAHATWNLLQPCTKDRQGYCGSGVYQANLVKINGQWFFKNLKITSNSFSAFELD